MPLFSDEVRQRCKLGDLVAEEIATLPEIEGCLIDDIPILESISVIPVDGGDGCDGIDGYDAQDGYDGVDGRDGLDAMDGYDAQDAADGADGRDGCDAIDGFDAQDGTDGADGRDGLDAIDGFDAQDGTDGVDGRDGLDAIDGFDAQDAADGVDGRDGLDAIDGFDAQDAADGADGRDGCDAIDGFDAQDAADGADGRDGCDGLDGHDAQDGTDGVDGRDSTGLCIRATNATGRNLPFGSAVGVSVSSLPKPPIDPPTGIGLEALLIEAERFHYFEDRSYHVVLPGKNTTLGITTEPIDAGDTGCIALSGIVRAVVNVRDTSHDSVTFTDGTTLLESTDSGDTEQPGQLSFLIRPTATGRQWCDLVFGGCGGTAQLGEFETATLFNTMSRNEVGYTTTGHLISGSMLDAGLSVEPATMVYVNGIGKPDATLAYALKRSIYPALAKPSIAYNATAGTVTYTTGLSNVASGATQYINW